MYIKSPMNYVGGKYKILDQLFSVLPKQVNTFIDLFAGGCNVGVNVNANTIICNDQLTPLIELYQYFQKHPVEHIINEIQSRISEFDLISQSEEGYYKLRERYNKDKNCMDFHTLVCFAFSNNIRFNKYKEFNIPFAKGTRRYNPRMEKNLINFHSAIHSKNIEFTNMDFCELDLSKLNKNDLVYCDPPYLISEAQYNNQTGYGKGWTEEEEHKLLDLLDELHKQDIKFALSNVFKHKGNSNEILIEWSKKYTVHNINKKYNNCSYNLKNRNAETLEVLITNL